MAPASPRALVTISVRSWYSLVASTAQMCSVITQHRGEHNEEAKKARDGRLGKGNLTTQKTTPILRERTVPSLG